MPHRLVSLPTYGEVIQAGVVRARVMEEFKVVFVSLGALGIIVLLAKPSCSSCKPSTFIKMFSTMFFWEERHMGLDFRKIASECRSRASEYKKKAERALLHSDQRYFALMAQQWFVIAEGYEAHLLKRAVVTIESRQRTGFQT